MDDKFLISVDRWFLRLAICGLFAGLVLPGTPVQRFGGVPLTGGFELVGLVLLVSLVTFQNNRAALFEVLKRLSSRLRLIVLFILGFLLVFKGLMFVSVPASGVFETCFRQLASDMSEECVAEFASPLSYGYTRYESEYLDTSKMRCNGSQIIADARKSSRITRTDKVISFGPLFPEARTLGTSSWNVNFVNSFRYDRGFWPWEPSDRDIQRVGFEAQWRGVVETKGQQSIQINYVGEGFVQLGQQCLELAGSYGSSRSLKLSTEGGRNELLLVYVFDDSQSGTDTASPYATLEVLVVDDIKTVNLMAFSPTLVSFVALVWDLVYGLGLFALGVFVAFRARSKAVRAVLIAVFVGLAGWIDLKFDFKILGKLEVSVAALILLISVRALVATRKKWPMEVAVLVISWVMLKKELAAILGFSVSRDYVPLRLRGNDQLVYHALAQEMLQSGFLRGAEDIFYFQPGIRYIFYLLQVLFGSGIIVSGTLIMSLMLYSFIWFSDQLNSADLRARLVTCLGLIVAVIWWSSSITIQSMTQGLSEFGTWPLLVFTGGLLMKRINSVFQGIGLGLALAVIPWIRPNQGLAALVILTMFLLAKRHSFTAKVTSAATFAGVLLMVPLHNLLFGRELVFLPRGHLFADQVKWTSILNVFSDDSLRRFFIDQVKGILYWPFLLRSIYSPQLAVAFLILLVIWFASVPMTLASIRRLPMAVFLHLVVLAQLVPFLKYSVFRYFPVHLMAIYLSMWVASMVIWTRSTVLLEVEETEVLSTAEHESSTEPR